MSASELVVLATPIFGAPLTPEQIATIESVPGVRVIQVSRDGTVHGDSGAAMERARVLLRGGVPASVLDHLVGRAPHLEWIHSFAAGVDRVATAAVRSRGLQVTNARGVFSRPIAEYVVMMCLAIARRLPQLLELQRERTWQPLRGRELGGMTIGIVGYGSIGHEVARLLAAFGPRLLATRRHVERGAGEHNVELIPSDQLDSLLRTSDIAIIAAPLTEETAGLIGAPQLQAMPEHAWLINIARGRLIDETALRRALEAGWIAGAVLDVFNEEPLPGDSPLYDTPNLIITPHTSWSSDRVTDRSLELFLANLRRFAAGEPLDNVVDLEAGY
ncbi:MAG TPA: D-2-hydroxyacid dehydrogenase [Candidatus Limnocylindria bacterium]|nr:D-2-hydroxyacid dehydrogenase [Candidatus Limnocylindria bacterium]